jgi:hypothetical protein
VLEVGQADVVVEDHPEAAPGHPGGGDLLGEDLVEAEVLDLGAAELLRHLEGQHPHLPGLGEDLAGDDPGLLPLQVTGRELGRDEAAGGLAEVLVHVFKRLPPHRSHTTNQPVDWESG